MPKPTQPNPQTQNRTGLASFGMQTGKAVFLIGRQQKTTPSQHSTFFKIVGFYRLKK
jgi:hypothetical protein